jgi:hypothetical protein
MGWMNFAPCGARSGDPVSGRRGRAAGAKGKKQCPFDRLRGDWFARCTMGTALTQRSCQEVGRGAVLALSRRSTAGCGIQKRTAIIRATLWRFFAKAAFMRTCRAFFARMLSAVRPLHGDKNRDD